jgi:3-hydroxybutyryl-CoA dehydrogenase
MTDNEPSKAALENIGILGAGQMGAAAAVMFRRAGHRVRLWTRREEKLREAAATLDAVDAFLDKHFGPAKSTAGELILEPNLETLDAESDALLECLSC